VACDAPWRACYTLPVQPEAYHSVPSSALWRLQTCTWTSAQSFTFLRISAEVCRPSVSAPASPESGPRAATAPQASTRRLGGTWRRVKTACISRYSNCKEVSRQIPVCSNSELTPAWAQLIGDASRWQPQRYRCICPVEHGATNPGLFLPRSQNTAAKSNLVRTCQLITAAPSVTEECTKTDDAMGESSTTNEHSTVNPEQLVNPDSSAVI